MKAKTLNELLKNYKTIFENLGFEINPKFDEDFLHLKRMQTNSTKISFIKKSKIKGLEENVKDFKLNPDDQEQREKYFTAVKPSKLISSLILDNFCNSKNDLFNRLSEQFNKDFLSTIKSKLMFYEGEEIAEQYYQNDTIVGCMSGQDEYFFDPYTQTENLQLATLKDSNNTLLIRSLLWYDKKNKNYWLDKSYEQSAINGENGLRKEYQERLLREVLSILCTQETNSLILTFGFGCAFADNLDLKTVEQIEKDFNTKIFKGVKIRTETETHTDTEGKETERETERSKKLILLNPRIKDFDGAEFEGYPYGDTFRSICRDTGKWETKCNEGNYNYHCCQSQDGEDMNSGRSCDCCGASVHRDEIIYSEYDDEEYCDDCAVYIDERDTYTHRENATYNEYSGLYHLSSDLC